jgi:hypothetical protein
MASRMLSGVNPQNELEYLIPPSCSILMNNMGLGFSMAFLSK